MDANRPLEYRSLPLRDDFPRSLALVAIVLGVSAGMAVSFGGAGYGALAAALLALMLLRYFVPTRYVLDGAGVRTRFLGREQVRRWSDVRSVYPHRDGVHLSPFERPSALDPFRGLFVRFAGNRDDVLAFCERHVRKAA